MHFVHVLVTNQTNEQKTKTKTLPAPKEKTKSVAVPKADLPVVDMPVPASNVSSTLKLKSPLRAPSNDLPEVDLTLPATEPVRLPEIQTHEKKTASTKKIKS